MSERVKKDQLIEVAKELNSVLGLDPAIDVKKSNSKVLQKKVTEAGSLIDPIEDEFTESTWAVLESLGAAYRSNKSQDQKETDEPTQQEEATEPEIEEQEEVNTQDDTSVSDQVDSELEQPELEEQEEDLQPEPEPESKPEPAKDNSSSSKKNITRMEAVVKALSKDSSAIHDKDQLDKLVKQADKYYVNGGGKSNLKETKWAAKTTIQVLKLEREYGIQ